MLNHSLCWDFSSHLAFFFFFFNSNKLSYLLLCLFFLVAMTTESSCKVSLYDACQRFFFPCTPPPPTLKSDNQKPESLPRTHVPTYSLPFHPQDMLFLGQTNAYLNAYQPFSSPEYFSVSGATPINPATHTLMHTISYCTITPLHKCNRTQNYGQPLMKLVLLGKTKLPGLIS